MISPLVALIIELSVDRLHSHCVTFELKPLFHLAAAATRLQND
jgi:hypothetical protein